MAAADASSRKVDWTDLLDDILGMIHSRVASPRGRVRFAAVCRSWRAAASQHPATPALPLLVLWPNEWSNRKHLYCPEEGMVLHVPVPSKLRATRFCGTYDAGWIATIRGRGTFAIANLFSGVEVELSTKQSNMAWQVQLITTIIFSEVPTSSGCILAALTTITVRWRCAGLAVETEGGQSMDVTVRNWGALWPQWGILYSTVGSLTQHSEKLFKFDIGTSPDGSPAVTAAHHLDVQWRGGPKAASVFTTYIFGLHGKLAMAVMARWFHNHKRFFKVFELAVTTDGAHDYEWKEVRALDDCALFLEQTCSSRVVHVPAGWRGVVEKNHIYYSNYRNVETKEYQELDEEVCLASSSYGGNIYCWKNPKSDVLGHGKEGFPSLGYYTTSHSCCPMWCFPPDS